MMIDKRLIGTVPESKKYIAANVALQWCGLLANVAMMMSVASLLASLLTAPAATARLLTTAAVAAAAVLIRWLCTTGAARMSDLSSRAVKKTLRTQIYEKLLRLGTSYSEQVSTAEVVQVAVEGVDQLETYFGAYLPQFFYAMLAPLTLFAVLCFVNVPAAIVLLVCVPLIPAAIAADMGKKAPVALLGAVHKARRYLSGESAGVDHAENLSGGWPAQRRHE